MRAAHILLFTASALVSGVQVLPEKCCAAIEATRLREQSDANFFQALQSHEKKGSVGAKLDELKAMLPTGVDASQAAALISSLKAELARE